MMRIDNYTLSNTQHSGTIARGRLDPELLHLAIEIGPLDPQLARGVPEVAAIGGQAVEDVLALEPGPGLSQWQGTRVLCAHAGHLQDVHDLLLADHVLGHEDD